MTAFRLATYRAEGRPRAGLLVNDSIVDLASALAADQQASSADHRFSGENLLAVLASWEVALPLLRRLATQVLDGRLCLGERAVQPLSQTRLLAPLLYPGAIYCAAANYVDHMKEMSGREPPDKRAARPYFFLKTPRHSVIGPDEPIRLPATSSQVDWEAEIAVVIGRVTRNVSAAEAMAYVAGYTIINDVSARDLMRRSDWHFGNDWFRGKCFDSSAPMGPWLTPADAVENPHDLTIRLWVNGQLMQDSSSRLMHFSIPEQIAYLSEQLTLLPGDVIATGTPAGVGRPRGRFLKPGDEVVIEIESLGVLRNRVLAADQVDKGGAEVSVTPP